MTNEENNHRKQYSPRKFDRATLLKLAATIGITAVLGDGLLTVAPWLDYKSLVAEIWDTPFRNEANLSLQQEEWVRYATLAPSGHNTQPWKFAIRENAILLIPDYSRCLSAVDPQNRELWISLGCALENLVIAANTSGYETDLDYPLPKADYITVHLRKTVASGQVTQREAIPHRQNNRGVYDGKLVSLSDLKHLETVPADAGVALQILTDAYHKEAIIEYIRAGDQEQFDDPPFVAELLSWLRFNKPEAFPTRDGLYTACSGNPNVPRWLGKRFVTAGSQSAKDVKAVRSSAGLIVLMSAQDDKRHWIETGRFYERLALTLTTSGIQTAFMNQPVEVATLRSQLQSYLHLDTAIPQLLMRFGYGPPMPRSLRRPLEDVLV